MYRRRDHGQCPAEVILHLRRLDALLKNHGLHHTAHTLEMEAGLFFEAAHLEQPVRQGLWASAHRYLRCFSALWGDGDGAATKYATLSSLSHHSILAWLACCGDEGGRAASLLRPSDEVIRKACPEEARRKDMYCSMTSQQARASVNWDDIKLETLARVQELVDLRPNLDGMLKNRLPRHKPTPQDVIPLGLRGSWRYRRKRVGHKPARDLAYFVLHKRLPSSHKIKQSVVKYPDRKSLLYTPKWSAKLNSGKDTEWPRTTVEFDEQQKENDFTRSDEISKKEAQDQCWI